MIIKDTAKKYYLFPLITVDSVEVEPSKYKGVTRYTEITTDENDQQINTVVSEFFEGEISFAGLLNVKYTNLPKDIAELSNKVGKRGSYVINTLPLSRIESSDKVLSILRIVKNIYDKRNYIRSKCYDGTYHFGSIVSNRHIIRELRINGAGTSLVNRTDAHIINGLHHHATNVVYGAIVTLRSWYKSFVATDAFREERRATFSKVQDVALVIYAEDKKYHCYTLLEYYELYSKNLDNVQAAGMWLSRVKAIIVLPVLMRSFDFQYVEDNMIKDHFQSTRETIESTLNDQSFEEDFASGSKEGRTITALNEEVIAASVVCTLETTTQLKSGNIYSSLKDNKNIHNFCIEKNSPSRIEMYNHLILKSDKTEEEKQLDRALNEKTISRSDDTSVSRDNTYEPLILETHINNRVVYFGSAVSQLTTTYKSMQSSSSLLEMEISNHFKMDTFREGVIVMIPDMMTPSYRIDNRFLGTMLYFPPGNMIDVPPRADSSFVSSSYAYQKGRKSEYAIIRILSASEIDSIGRARILDEYYRLKSDIINIGKTGMNDEDLHSYPLLKSLPDDIRTILVSFLNQFCSLYNEK